MHPPSTAACDPMQPLIEELLLLIRSGRAVSGPAPMHLAQVADGALRLREQLDELRGAGTAQQAADIEELSGLIEDLIARSRPCG